MIPSDLSIHPAGFPNTSGVPAAGNTDAVQREAGSQDNTSTAGNHQVDGWVEIDRSRFPFSKQQMTTSNLNAVARSIRVVDKTMKEIGTQIDDMKSQLQTHVKNYPPFPPGSEERVKMLKSFSAFRKLIDELTIPPNDDQAARIMNTASSQTGDSGIVLEHKGFAKAIRSQPVGTGPDGLDIPEFPSSATDEDFRFMIGKLDKASATLETRRAGLQADANDIFNSPGA